MIIKEHENMHGTGGYNIIRKRKNSKWLYLEFWGAYGNDVVRVTEAEAREKEWIK